MKKINGHIFLWWFFLLLIIPASSYIGYRYGYKKAIRADLEKKRAVASLSTEKAHKKKTAKAVASQKVEKEISKKEAIGEKEEKKEREEIQIPSCKEARQNIMEFLFYLNQKEYLSKYLKGKDIKKQIALVVKKLSQNLPNPEGEGANDEIMIRNIYHLFRTLSLEEIKMIKQILDNESDQMEYIMSCYYVWLSSQDKCPNLDDILPSMKVAYTYASFFLNTIGGRSYLFRRSNPLQLLLRYYCVLIVNDMAKKGENIYNINISPMVKELRDELSRFPELRFQDHYIATLNKISNE